MRRTAQVIAWAVATALLIYFVSKVDRAQLSQALAMVRWSWIVVAILANAMILVSWTALWWTVSPDRERPSYGVMFEINSMASALMNTLPFLGGHAAAVVLMIKRAGMTRAGALSVMALDQLGEGFAKVTVFGLVALLAPIPGWMRIGIATVCVGVAAMFLALVIVSHGHGHLLPSPDEKRSWIMRLRSFAARWAERMETLRSVRRSLIALAFAIGTKVAEGAALLMVQYAFGVDLPFGSTVLVFAAIVLGSVLPVAPGNLGTYEAGAVIAYGHVGVEPGLATILAVTAHVCFLIPSIGVGYALGSWRLRDAVAVS